MGLFKKYVTCIMAFFTLFKHLSHFVNFTQTLPLWYSLNFTKKEWEKRIFFSYLAASAYHVISKEVRNHILRRNLIFRHTCCINNPHWQSGRIIIFLCKYYIGRHFLGCALFVACCNITRITWDTKKK